MKLLEAARMDGANEVQIFWRVIIPMIRSTHGGGGHHGDHSGAEGI
jgi:ABC-type spermidine/putrescine transport system permease subunit II